MKISIIIPVYNAADTIYRTVHSIDTKRDTEIICINDGSTDETADRLDTLKQQFPTMKVIHQENQGAAASRNKGLSHMTGDAFMFIDADDEFLTSRIDLMADAFEEDSNIDIVVGQLGRDYHGEWKAIPTHQPIQKHEKVTFAQCPELLQSIGPGAKLFDAKLNDLRFDTDVVFCEEHTFMTQAYKRASDIQLLPQVVYGYNQQSGSVTEQRVDRFHDYMKDALKVRKRVMDALMLLDLRLYYSYRMDELIVSYLIQGYLTAHSTLSQEIIDDVTEYIEAMQHTDYDGGALFRIVKAVEQAGTGWTKSIYEEWQQTLIGVGIKRPQYYIFKAKVLPKRLNYKGKTQLKRRFKK
ncbi:glycosyltransferase family 2 protein [Staphylococcus auricularis]|uniref:glycosyltransferase family 2 protein n=1 Tax=Staphylococcus auricularis TaxID=29379 RepID=UPI001245D86A|nr:glycosyltransferase family 2 protein [Staphylococcus auricularis]HJE01512.1 glycosyltransferase [Staphylococcus auricularis]